MWPIFSLVDISFTAPELSHDGKSTIIPAIYSSLCIRFNMSVYARKIVVLVDLYIRLLFYWPLSIRPALPNLRKRQDPTFWISKYRKHAWVRTWTADICNAFCCSLQQTVYQNMTYIRPLIPLSEWYHTLSYARLFCLDIYDVEQSHGPFLLALQFFFS